MVDELCLQDQRVTDYPLELLSDYQQGVAFGAYLLPEFCKD